MEKFRPLSPDPFLVQEADMSLAKFGHINAIVDELNAIIPSTNGLMYQSQYDPFNTGTVNDSRLFSGLTPAYYLSRLNHVGTQPQSTIDNLESDLLLKGDMFKIVYDTNNDGIVNNSDQLGSQLPSYYLDRSNHTGFITIADVTNLQTSLDSKVDDSEVGVTIATLSGGLVPLAQLPFGAPLYQGLYNASTNTPAILNGVGVAGQFYIASVIGNAYAPVNVTLVNQIVAYSGTVWEVGGVFTGGISDVNGQTGPVVTLDLDDIANTATRAAVTPAQAQGIAASPFAINVGNPAASQQDITNINVSLASKGDMFRSVYDVTGNGIVDNSERLGNQLPAYYRNRANHTGTQAQSTVVNLITDLAAKIPFTQKGANSGVCELDVNGFVPAARLNLSALNYKNSWDVFTNSPFISDGIGVAGDTYIVGYAGPTPPFSRNLGSGAIQWSVGDLAIYNGTIWQRISAASSGVISVNSQTGVVTLTTDQVPEGLTAFYLTADQSDAADGANAPSAANPFATVNDLTPLTTDITDIQTDIISINVDLNLKQDLSEKGVAGGYAPLDGGGKIPNSYLNFSAFDYQNSWDALTNSPVLADGAGAAGDAYIVGVAGTQDLGSGSITFNVGDLVIYNGTVWQKIVGVAPGVSSVNGFTGAVTLTADNIAESATRFYLTALQNSAVDAANNPTNLNPFATLADLASVTTTVMATIPYFWDLRTFTTYVSVLVDRFDVNCSTGGGFFRWVTANNTLITNIPGFRVKPNATTTGYWQRVFDGPIKVDWFGTNGLTTTLLAQGINQTEANLRYGTNFVNATTDTYDFAAIKTAFRLAESPGYGAVEFSHREYYINRGVKLPRFQVDSSGTKLGQSFFDISGRASLIKATPSYTPTQTTAYSATVINGNPSIVVSTAEIGAICVGNSITGTGIQANTVVTAVSNVIGPTTTITVAPTPNGNGATISVTAPVAMFDRVPPSQYYALDYLGGYIGSKFDIYGFAFDPNGTTAWGGSSYAIRLGPSYGSNIHDNTFAGFNRNIYLEFCLNAAATQNKGSYYEYSIYIDDGRYWGGSNSNSQCNVTTLHKNATYGTGTREEYDLTLGGASVGGNITVTLDSIAYVIPVSAGTTIAVASEISTNNSNSGHAYYHYFGDNYTNPPDLQGWDVTNPSNGVVHFKARTGGNKVGTFSFSGGATGLTGVLTETVAGTEFSISPFFIRATSGVVMDDNIVEGEFPRYGVYFNNDSSTVVKDFTIRNMHVETTCSESTFYIRSGNGVYNIDGIFNQYDHRNFVTFDNTGGYPILNIKGITSSLPLYYAFSDDGIQPTFTDFGGGNNPSIDSVSVTGTLTNGSNVITAVSDTSNITLGDRVCDYRTGGFAHGIPMGAIVSNKTVNTITMTFKNGTNCNATVTGARNIYAQNSTTGNYQHPYCPLIYRRVTSPTTYLQPTPLWAASSTPDTASGPLANWRIMHIPLSINCISNNPFSGI
jgi:hypothetical protein